MSLLLKLQIALGYKCPGHGAPTYFVDDYTNAQCSVTNKSVRDERK